MTADDTPTDQNLEPLQDDDRWMTTDQVAAEWGRNVETVRRWIRDGHLPATRTPGGRTLMVKRSDVLTTFERGRANVNRRGEALGDSDAIGVPGDRTILRD